MTADTSQLPVLTLVNSGSLPNPRFESILSKKNGWIPYNKVPSASWKNFKRIEYDETGDFELFIAELQSTKRKAIFRNPIVK